MECEFCQNHEQGDTLYEPSDWDGGIGFDYIRDIKYCPLCGKKLNSEDEPTISKMEQVDEPERNMAEDIVESFGFKAESYRQAKAKTEQTERSE